MKVVLDTNVLIAAFITRGACGDVFEHCARHHEIITSDFILSEFRRHLVGKFRFHAGEAKAAIELLCSRAKVVTPAQLGEGICRDPADDVILGTAVAGSADCIVTGDTDLLVIGKFRSIDIVRPAAFAEYEAARMKQPPA